MPVPQFDIPEWRPEQSMVIRASPAVGWRIAHALCLQHEELVFVRHSDPTAGTKRWWRGRQRFSDLRGMLAWAEEELTSRIANGSGDGEQTVAYIDQGYHTAAERGQIERLIRVGAHLGFSVLWLSEAKPEYQEYPMLAVVGA